MQLTATIEQTPAPSLYLFEASPDVLSYWRTGKGSHKHRDFWCANARRSIFTGDCTLIPKAEWNDWEPCEACCTASDFAAYAAPAFAKPAGCRNSGVTRPGRIYSHCKDCGKEGKVNRATGKIRAHAPLEQ